MLGAVTGTENAWVFCELPKNGTVLVAGEPYAELESVKAVSDVVAPLSGEVADVNEALGAEPDLVNRSPYGDGWLVRVRLTDLNELGLLISAEQYRELIR